MWWRFQYKLPFWLDFIRFMYPLYNSCYNYIQKCSSVPIITLFCLYLKHQFSDSCLDLEILINLILVGIPKSSTEGVWISNGMAHFKPAGKFVNQIFWVGAVKSCFLEIYFLISSDFQAKCKLQICWYFFLLSFHRQQFIYLYGWSLYQLYLNYHFKYTNLQLL